MGVSSSLILFGFILLMHWLFGEWHSGSSLVCFRLMRHTEMSKHGARKLEGIIRWLLALGKDWFTNRWLTFAICLIEILITIKFHEGSPNYLDNPTPLYVIIPWAVVLVLSFGMYFYQRFRPGHTEKYPKEQVFQKLQNGEAKGKKPKKKTAWVALYIKYMED